MVFPILYILSAPIFWGWYLKRGETWGKIDGFIRKLIRSSCTWNPNDPVVLIGISVLFLGGLTFKNRGHLGSRYIYIFFYLFLLFIYLLIYLFILMCFLTDLKIDHLRKPVTKKNKEKQPGPSKGNLKGVN